MKWCHLTGDVLTSLTGVAGVISAHQEPVKRFHTLCSTALPGMPADAAEGEPQLTELLSGPAMDSLATSGVRMQEAGGCSTGTSQVSQGMDVTCGAYSLSLWTGWPVVNGWVLCGSPC